MWQSQIKLARPINAPESRLLEKKLKLLPNISIHTHKLEILRNSSAVHILIEVRRFYCTSIKNLKKLNLWSLTSAGWLHKKVEQENSPQIWRLLDIF